MKLHPTQFVCVDENEDAILTITAIDGDASTIKFDQPVGIHEWRKIADLVQQALNQMHGEHV